MHLPAVAQTPADSVYVNPGDSMFISPAEENGRVIVATQDQIERYHSPRKATIMSAIMPGLGQAYNKKYWKMPIIYGGIGVSVYYLQGNLAKIKDFKQSYRFATDDDPNTINTSGYSPSQLQELVVQHKKWRDYSYLAIGLVYILQMVDANVDAHLFRFDVSENLSLQFQPSLNMTAQPTAGISLCLKL
jgi:hypothetical protein